MNRHFYTTETGLQIILEAELGKGGEGSVWRVQGSPEIVAKIYHHHKRTAAQEAKLRAMLAEPPMQKGPGGHITIAWPKQLLFTHQHCAGFTVARIEQCPDIFQIYNPRLRQTSYPACDRRFLHRTASNLAAAFRLLHARGYVIGDVNQKNILVTADAQVTLIDTDSFQVRDPASGLVHPCLVATPEYLPRELQGQALDQIIRESCHDLFGLAVLLFQLLMEGRHPCVGVPRDSSRNAPSKPREWVREGVFPYTRNPHFGPPPAAPDFHLLHPELQSLFLCAFINGNQAPSARPSAKEWYAGLKAAEGDLLRCGKDAEHWYYGANSKKCHLCNQAQKAPIKSIKIPVKPRTEPKPPRPVSLFAVPWWHRVKWGFVIAIILLVAIAAVWQKGIFSLKGLQDSLSQQKPKQWTGTKRDGFDFRNNDVVLDERTGLMWARNVNLAGKPMNWNDAITWIKKMNLSGYRDWRLPTKDELVTVAKRGGARPAEYYTELGYLNIALSGNTRFYWSSTNSIGNKRGAYIVDLIDGKAGYDTNTASNYYIWPVRTEIKPEKSIVTKVLNEP